MERKYYSLDYFEHNEMRCACQADFSAEEREQLRRFLDQQLTRARRDFPSCKTDVQSASSDLHKLHPFVPMQLGTSHSYLVKIERSRPVSFVKNMSKRLLRSSASREWESMLDIWHLGGPVLKPLAFAEGHRFPGRYYSVLILEASALETKCLSTIIRTGKYSNYELGKQLAPFIAELHRRGVYQMDFSHTEILGEEQDGQWHAKYLLNLCPVEPSAGLECSSVYDDVSASTSLFAARAALRQLFSDSVSPSPSLSSYEMSRLLLTYCRARQGEDPKEQFRRIEKILMSRLSAGLKEGSESKGAFA